MPNPCLLRDWTDSRKVNALDAFAERFFGRFMMRCDDFGRFHSDPLLLKSALFPLLPSVRVTDISRWSADCAAAGLIRSYVAGNGRTYLEVLNFGQRKKWMKAAHPPPEGQIGLPLLEKLPATCRSRSRSRGEESAASNGHPPPNFEIKNGEVKKRETWQLLSDERQLTERIKQELKSLKPDQVLIESLKLQRVQVRTEMKIIPS